MGCLKLTFYFRNVISSRASCLCMTSFCYLFAQACSRLWRAGFRELQFSRSCRLQNSRFRMFSDGACVPTVSVCSPQIVYKLLLRFVTPFCSVLLNRLNPVLKALSKHVFFTPLRDLTSLSIWLVDQQKRKSSLNIASMCKFTCKFHLPRKVHRHTSLHA